MAHLVAACTAEPLGVRADSGPACREVSLMEAGRVAIEAGVRAKIDFICFCSRSLLYARRGCCDLHDAA